MKTARKVMDCSQYFFFSFTDLKMQELICKRTTKQYKLIREEIELGESKHLAHLFGMTLLGKVELDVS